MKHIYKLIIVLSAFLVIIPAANAKFCNPPDRTGSFYEDIYCDLKFAGTFGEDLDEELIKIISEQLEYPEELTKLLLDEGITITNTKLNTFLDEEGIDAFDLPPDIYAAWLDSTNWIYVISKVNTAYEKEKVLYHTKKTMEYEFKTSEKYWDGEIRDIGDAPFDLIVDLNLIEIVLFGSRAEWTNDVYSFPPEDESDGSGEDDDSPQIPTGDEGGGEGEGEGEGEDDDIISNVNESEGTPADECVPNDDDGADIGNHPGSNYINPQCGNNVVEKPEECDDGNLDTGDGCNQYCMLEATGANDMCQDPEAVTFGKPPSAGITGSTSTGGDTDNDNIPDCPEGTSPSTHITIAGPPPITPEYPESDQSANYPGPNVGGTFKEVPESTRPPCPPGQSEVMISYPDTVTDDEGNTTIVTKEEKTCILTELCADLEFLGEDNAVEFMYCINIVKANRPETPYTKVEGCIDCHIAAMVDALDEALETNVTPLVNTTGGFALSSAWGPKFSFNLTTALKSTIHQAIGLKSDPKDEINKALKDVKDKTDSKGTSIASSENASDTLANNRIQKEQQTEAVLETLKNYRNASNLVSDQEFYPRVSAMLEQMAASFTRIHNKYAAVAEAIKLDSKEVCQ